MKNVSIFISIFLFCISSTFPLLAQVEVKGADSTSATRTWFTTNNKTTPDTTMVVLDDGKVGIGTTNPTTKLEVNGVIYSTSGGVKFPNGTIQSTASTGGVAYQHVFTVSPSGGDFTLISQALLACSSPGPGNTYLIRVMPGTYVEFTGVNCLPYVDLIGAGKNTTIIQGSVSCADNSTLEGFKIKTGVVCSGTSPTITHNIITNINEAGNGIDIGQGGKPWIIENEIIDCEGWGIYIHDVDSDPWVLGNKIFRNVLGGLLASATSPIISNNYFFKNKHFGIRLVGFEFSPSNPTVTDNVIDSIDYNAGGYGIYMDDKMNASIIGNTIHHCEFGIWINADAQPSIISNNISFNYEAGIVCNSNGFGKSVVIKSNHIHSNINPSAVSHKAGIYIMNYASNATLNNLIITHNNIHNNPDPQAGGSDIDYSSSASTTVSPMISLNVFDVIFKNSSPAKSATGLYNVTSGGISITP